MKVVIDTSVLVAASITTGGACAEAVRLAFANHVVYISQFILDELHRKLIIKPQLSEADATIAVDWYRARCQSVKTERIEEPRLRDPDDLAIIATVAAANADVVITVDNDLLSLKQIQHTRIVKPGYFIVQNRGSS